MIDKLKGISKILIDLPYAFFGEVIQDSMNLASGERGIVGCQDGKYIAVERRRHGGERSVQLHLSLPHRHL